MVNTNYDYAYSLDELKLNVHSAIYDAKAKNETSVYWKPLLPTDAKNIDSIVLYLIQQGCKVNPNQSDESILISWEDQ